MQAAEAGITKNGFVYLHVHLGHSPWTAGGRIIATLAYIHLRAIRAHLRCDPPFPPKFNVDWQHNYCPPRGPHMRLQHWLWGGGGEDRKA